jgi:Gti1/Pac2 family
MAHGFIKDTPSITMETYFGYIKCTQDALVLFKACQLGIVPRVRRRLSDRERSNIRSGSVFIWYEREAGMRRWTDGRSWSPSRVAGSFLTYKELSCKQKKRFLQSSQVTFKKKGLIKQSFSITTQPSEKIHMISYYSEMDLANQKLSCPTEDPRLLQAIKSANYSQYKFESHKSQLNHSALPTTLRVAQQWQSPVPTMIMPYSDEDDRFSCTTSILTSPSLTHSPDCNSVSTTSIEEPLDLPVILASCRADRSGSKCDSEDVTPNYKIRLPPIIQSSDRYSKKPTSLLSANMPWKSSEDERQLKALHPRLLF